MRMLLLRHPESHSDATMEVEIGCPTAGKLEISYILRGKIEDIRLPKIVESGFAEELWHHTCFEAFIHASPGPGYYEFNFAPSTEWTAYRFSDYRNGRCLATEVAPPGINASSTPDCYILETSLALNDLNLPRGKLWQLGLSAVIEDRDGGKSFWALAHPPGKPDFHHAKGFVHEFYPGFCDEIRD
jgi:hypothetical protein